ncbi:MAG: cytochrome c biogenesis protein CcsA [Deltaproteobacteria bacterium]|nr:cytochrome c biogenesis protein CcsA [Deltaproteobacteria bacterium]
MDLRLFEGIFLWGAVASYLIGFMVFVIAIVFEKRRYITVGWVLAITGFTCHSITIVFRWMLSGHPPFFDNYEHFLAEGWFFMLIYIVLATKSGKIRRLGVGVLPFCALFLGYGIMAGEFDPQPMSPPYKSLWLWAHAVSWFGHSAFFIAGITSVLYLIKDKGYLKILPSTKDLDLITFRMIIFGFITLTIGTGAGALWAHGLWGRYWAWDPIETWTLIIWVIYGANIHLRTTYKWNGKKGAYLAIASLIAVYIALGGIGFVGGVHTSLL